jgi:hypothetical protein
MEDLHEFAQFIFTNNFVVITLAVRQLLLNAERLLDMSRAQLRFPLQKSPSQPCY